MQHFYQKIPGWFSFKDCYLDAVREASKYKKSIFVEIGSWKGRSTAFMGVEIANSRKPIEFYAIDHFKGSDEKVHHDDPDVQRGTLYSTYLKNIAPVSNYVTTIPHSSVEASQRFADQSIDFLFLDGSHEYKDVALDLATWLPKMKPFAVIGGDDINWAGVKDAVYETFKRENVEILGEGKGRHWRVKL